MLNTKQRAQLRAMANPLAVTLIIGKEGVTDAVERELDALLESHELVKGKVLESAMLTPRTVSEALCEATGADAVQCIGAKFVLYRQSSDEDKRKIVLVKRTGILGGTFNPPASGTSARGGTRAPCAELRSGAVHSDQYSAAPKVLPENTASAEDRCEMVRRLTAEKTWAMLDTIEIDRGGASYTVDTLRALHARGETDLHLIVGTDMLLSFDKIWRAPDEIARLASLAVCARENEDWDALREKAAALKDSLGATVELVQGDSLTISSTELRQGGALRCYTPESVADYIEEKHLYGY